MSITANAVNAAASPEALLASLRWRVATKKFDPAKKISDAHWAALEEALVLAPSSYGLQAWKFFVVNDPALRAKMGQNADFTKALAARMPNAKAEIIPDAGHLVMLDAEPTFNALMLGFLAAK